MSDGRTGETLAYARQRLGPEPLTPATWAWLIALLGWSALLSFYALDADVGFEPIDCWVAQTAREMRGAGDWLVPRFSGETRMQKSPGPYWAVMAVSLLRKTPVDEVSARIPSAVAAVLLAGTIFWLTRRIAGNRAAVFAGFAAASSVFLLWWSHRGASDLGLTAFTTLSLAAVWIALEDEARGWRRNVILLLAYFAAGLGMLYKMPMPLPVVGLPAVVYMLVRRRWAALWDRWHLAGIVVFLLPWLPWAIAVALAEPNAMAKWKVEFFDRFTGDLPNVSGQRKWFFHFIYLVPPLLYCLPFSLSLPAALGRAFRPPAGVRRDGTLFAVIWFISLFVFFTVSAGKELRYFLPALPPLFVLLGIELAKLFDPARTPSPRRDRVAAWAVWILVPLAFVGGVFVVRAWYKRIGYAQGLGLAEIWPLYAVAAVIFVGGTALAAWLYVRRREHGAFAALVGTMWVLWLWVWPQVMPIFMAQQGFRDLAAQINERLSPAQRALLRQVGSQDSRITWYGDCRFPRLIDQLKLLEMQGGRRSLKREVELIGRKMVDVLAGDELALLIASRQDYLVFQDRAPALLAKEGRSMPPVHLWLQSRHSAKSSQYVVFSNQAPSWPEPALDPPSERFPVKAKVADLSSNLSPTTAATDASTGSAPAAQP